MQSSCVLYVLHIIPQTNVLTCSRRCVLVQVDRRTDQACGLQETDRTLRQTLHQRCLSSSFLATPVTHSLLHLLAHINNLWYQLSHQQFIHITQSVRCHNNITLPLPYITLMISTNKRPTVMSVSTENRTWHTNSWRFSSKTPIRTKANVNWQRHHHSGLIDIFASGSMHRELHPWGYMWNSHFGGNSGRRGVSDATIRRNNGGLLQALNCDHCAFCNHLVAICHIKCLWCSNQQVAGNFGAKFGDEGVDQCKPNFNTIVCKRNRVNNFYYWAQCTNVTDHGTITIGEITCQQCCLKIMFTIGQHNL